jgi:hypothetical protein
MKTAALSALAILGAASAFVPPAFAQGLALPDGHVPVPDETVPGHGAPMAPPPVSSNSVGFEPMLLEIGEGETLSFPRSYDQRPCPEPTIRRIFTTELEDDFVASLRCWAIPQERSGEFVQVLDQAVAAAGWEFQSAAGMGAHYTKDGKTLDVLVFGFDQYGEEGETDVGYLFGVVEAE